ncbi:tryptophan--tRNA ligase [Albimonas sp. CAU 1670]|uniref:tryptophan--tRNA ligase n=1 Tax=Albimonas sp. CAU 1670 TaxID=3032599 RepID=UPI0023D9D9CA|nr:tryptophan--tRNA ligase [Albimonas sp. CAU 1670]MDF2231069.1 tryptophan--tRNA ligase [Albimonas sp. CAU 1670]
MNPTQEAQGAETEGRVHPRRVFSGVQPTGNLHLGNYLGAVKRFVEMQDEAAELGGETIYCMVDMHALTINPDPAELKRATRELACAFIACGLDPEKSILFNQSQVPAHAELAWIFNCVARVGWMNRMTQFKEKAGKNREAASVGLYAYPVLMAADILAYRATHVPVGEDQKQHLELTRDIATKFNLDYGQPGFFPLTEPLIEGVATRVMSLRDGSKKMSKSDASDMSRINLTDDADAIAQKIRKARTDPEPLPETLEGLAERPEAKNLVGIMAALSNRTAEQVVGEWAGKPFSEFKPALAELAVESLAPIAGRMRELSADPAHIDQVLAKGAEKADAIAAPIIDEVYDVVGLLRSRRR